MNGLRNITDLNCPALTAGAHENISTATTDIGAARSPDRVSGSSVLSPGAESCSSGPGDGRPDVVPSPRVSDSRRHSVSAAIDFRAATVEPAIPSEPGNAGCRLPADVGSSAKNFSTLRRAGEARQFPVTTETAAQLASLDEIEELRATLRELDRPEAALIAAHSKCTRPITWLEELTRAEWDRWMVDLDWMRRKAVAA